ncbi:MAG: FumA C-terminus/TtdB family hydratase beta subunit [Actinobacteria bacterium]|nr:FumA C-terminus/TtdB family hydratase beta subunit [Actinomycetota bacterium]
MVKEIRLPLTPETARLLRAGDEVGISGTIYAARDVACRRLAELIRSGERLPVDLHDQVIFFAGPTPVPPGRACGAVGPTTSKRMDPYTPELLEAGVRGMIGKGPRSPEVVSSIRRFRAVYFVATGGAAALLSTFVTRCEVFAWPELGPEAIWRLALEAFPAFVAIDIEGGDIFTEGRKGYSSNC